MAVSKDGLSASCINGVTVGVHHKRISWKLIKRSVGSCILYHKGLGETIQGDLLSSSRSVPHCESFVLSESWLIVFSLKSRDLESSPRFPVASSPDTHVP